ncbi:MAG: hypothetical protein AB9858_08555 [Acidaminococcaceae bacterium]
MVKRLLMFFLTLILILAAGTVFAEESKESMKDKLQQYQLENDPAYQAALAAKQANMPKVVVLYVNNAKSTYDDEVDQKIKTNLAKAISPDKYLTIDGAPYIEKLKKAGTTDIATAERADIISAFAGENIDYVVFLEVQPFITRDKMTFFTIGKDVTATVPFKMIDLVNNKYLYNGKFTEKASDSSAIGGIGNKSVAMKALDKINEQINATIAERLPAAKQAPIPQK